MSEQPNKPAEKTAGPADPLPPSINGAEDAVMAYLREEIDEKELRQYAARYSVVPGELVPNFNPRNRPDAAFKRKIPDDLLFPVGSDENPLKDQKPDTLENRLEAVDEKQKEREEATKEDEKRKAKTPDPSLKSTDK